MATKKFIIEVEEGYTHCDDCPINCDGKCPRGEIEKFGLDCDILNFFTMRIKELEEEKMREIKFRAKRVDKDEFAYGDHLTGMGYKKGKHYILPLLSHYPSDYHSLDGYEVIPDTIGQYTGLKDKNGKEIYEGDIVEWVFFYERLGANMGVKEDDTTVKGIIQWRQGGFILEVIENDFENAGYYSISALCTDTESDVEIIGNIHDNPELIKEEEK